MILTITLTGLRPMLMHNGRLADPRDQYTRGLKPITKKRDKTDDDLIEIMQIEARGGCYETPDGMLGLPTANVWAGLFEAGKAYKLGASIERALLFEDVVMPVLLPDGEEVSCEDFLKNAEHVDYRSVVINGRRTMRARPRVPAGWRTVHEFELLTEELELQKLVPVFARMGKYVGVGDFRPRFGRCEVTHGND